MSFILDEKNFYHFLWTFRFFLSRAVKLKIYDNWIHVIVNLDSLR